MPFSTARSLLLAALVVAPVCLQAAPALAQGGPEEGAEAADGAAEAPRASTDPTIEAGPEGPAAPETASPDDADLAVATEADAAGEVEEDDAPTTRARTHSPWHIGFALGSAGVSRAPYYASSFNVQVGGRINDRFSIGADLNAIGSEHRAFASALIEGIFFPSRKLGLNVQGGLGVAATGRIASTTTVYGGLGYGAAAGWEFQIKKRGRFNLGLQARLDGIIHSNPRARHIWAAGAMLTFSWW